MNKTSVVSRHPVVSRDQWTVARKALLAREKELTRLRDELSAQRRALPWVKVDKAYTFQAADGEHSLDDLFGGNSQLVVYHFMLAPGQKEGCVGCSFLTDHLEGAIPHLEHHDVSVVLISRASVAEIQRYQSRMGWQLKWLSTAGNSFNHDFQVSYTPEQLASGKVEYNYQMIEPWGEDAHGISVFIKDTNGDIFHTYSSYARGGEVLIGAYAVLDMTPNGRAETGEGSGPMHWVKRHDQYDAAPKKLDSSCCG